MNFTTIADIIAYYKAELLMLKTSKERAERLLEIMRKEKERCDSMGYMEAVSSTIAMVQFMKNTKLSQELQAAIISLSDFLSTGHIKGHYFIDHKPKFSNELALVIFAG
jgi:flagellar biosynthesis regulator FlaF